MRFLVGLLLFLSLSVSAQSPLGSVTGIALDPSGAPVPNALVRLTSVDSGVQVEMRTNQSGAYLFPNLTPGSYTLTATAQGFKTIDVPRFQIFAFQTQRQDLPLSLPTASAEVTVIEAASPLLRVDTPSVSSTLTSEQVLDLPTNLRSIYNNSGDSGLIANIMPLTIPGVVQMGNGAYWLTPGAGPNGLRLKVDGIDTTFGNFGSPDPVSQPSMESVQEFTANIVGNKAEFNGLGSVTTVTKTGTNQIHGSVFWYMRNSALDARNTFSPQKPFQNMQDFGGSAGGPLKKDKTFLTGTYEGFRGTRGYIFSPNVPTTAMRAGDFGSSVVRDPYNSNTPFPNNVIPVDRMSPEAIRAQRLLYPLPNFGPPSLTAANYRAAFNGPEEHDILEGRIDHNFTSGNAAFFRYQYKRDDYDIPGARSTLPPTTAGTSDNRRSMNFFTIGDTWSIRPNLYNELRGGVVVLGSGSSSDINGQKLLDEIGIKGLPPRPYAPGVPNFNVAGLNTYTQTLLNPVNDGHWQASDALTWMKGRHTMKFGVEYIRWFVNRYLNTNAALFGNYTFQNRFTGQPYGDFLLGLPTTVTRLDPFLAQYFRWNDLSFFAQDDWKITSRLTLSYGIRYEYNQPAATEDGNLYSFDPANGAVIVPDEQSRQYFSPFFPSNLKVITAATVGLNSSLRTSDLNNWAPRLGFSYALDSAGRTILRGGYGIYYGHFSVAAMSGQTGGPFAVSTTSNNAFVNGQPVYTLRDPFAAPSSPGTLNLNGVSANLRNMYSQQYTVSLEREITRPLVIRASYIGTKGTQLPYMANINQPPPSTVPFNQSRRPYTSYNNIVYAANGANSSYQGFQFGVTGRFNWGLQVASTYVLAKQLSEVDDTNNAEINTQIEDAYDRARDRANVYSVPRQQWLNNAVWDLNLGRKWFSKGWQLNAMLNLSTGNWLNPQFTGSDPSNTNTFGGRPDVVAPLEYPETLSAWFTRTSFGVPPNGRFGNAGRNIVQGPGYVIFNMGASKTTSMEKLGSLVIGVSFQNLFNHVNYGQPLMTVNVANGGTITSTAVFAPAGTARTGMITARWQF